MRVWMTIVLLMLAVPLAYSIDVVEKSRPRRIRSVPRFEFVRIRYHGPLSLLNENGWVPPWMHDYPRAEKNFLTILFDLTRVKTSPDAYLILDLEDPAIMFYPMLYVSEPGFWDITEAEAANLREYLQRGGFVVFDDFRGENELQVFASSLKRVFPDRNLERLTVDHPIFHCFYDIATLEMIPPYQVPGKPTFYGLSDPQGRLQVVANFNNDIGDYWEWSDAALVPVGLSNEAYKFGVNYVIYALTH